jgi:hypothetical protein
VQGGDGWCAPAYAAEIIVVASHCYVHLPTCMLARVVSSVVWPLVDPSWLLAGVQPCPFSLASCQKPAGLLVPCVLGAPFPCMPV